MQGLLALCPGCCIDYQPDVQQTLEPATPADTSEPDEPCDGLDNDGDGQVDERHHDADGDGVADCIDEGCEVELSTAENVLESPACEVALTPPADPWAIELLWETPWQNTGCVIGSVVVDVNEDGYSDLLCPNFNRLFVYSGDDGHILWASEEFESFSPLAVADLDGDGALEIVGISPLGEVVCLDGEGAVKWRSAIVDERRGFTYLHSLEIADLLGDGTPEVVVNQAVLSALDGSLVSTMENEVYGGDNSIVVGDLDQDSVQEIVVRGRAFDAFGMLEWSVPESEYGYGPNTPVAIQADEDDEAEIALVALDRFRVVEADGRALVEIELPAERDTRCVACAGDVDGDGEMEVLISDETKLRAMDLHGNEEWAADIDDDSSYVGCTVFDFDLDGAKEVLLSDENDFFIFDGRSGAVLFQDERMSATLGDIPLVVDLDGDGSVEIVVLIYGAYDGRFIRVFGNVNRDWPPGSRIWPSATWSGTSLFLDGSVPRTPEAPWLTTKVWRGQPEFMIAGMDLRPEIMDWCVSSCDEEAGQVLLALRVVNLGPKEVQRGVSVAVYSLAAAGARQLLGTVEYPEFIDNGTASAAQQIALTVEQARAGVLLVAGDEGQRALAVEDCDPSNNELEWRLADCD